MKLAELKQAFDEKLAQKEELRKKSEHMELMLDRASQLVSGLTGEKERWENTVKVIVYYYVFAFCLIKICYYQIIIIFSGF
jgi:predicted nuclease with TOPRIM domain